MCKALCGRRLRMRRPPRPRKEVRVWRFPRSAATVAERSVSSPEQLQLSEERAHIGSFEMDQCQTVIDLCKKFEQEEAA